MRIGHGFDAHQFSTQGDLILGGEIFPEANKLEAHSDGDVLLHAVCDALLGAVALGDIGKYFPDTDDKWKNVNSRELLRQVVLNVAEHGYSVVNLDVTVIAQTPRISTAIERIKNNLADDTNSNLEQINVKATTTEKMGYIGREEGIAVHAVCLLSKIN